LVGGLVGAAGLALYSAIDLYNAEKEQKRVFAEAEKESRQRLFEQQQKEQKQQEKQEGPAPEPDASGAGARKGGGKSTPHAEQRAAEARSGDTQRQVGDRNRVVREGRKFRDTVTGNTVHILGNRAVVTRPDGTFVSQFRNTRRNTQRRIRTGRWEPVQ
jgi:hypothetical protein